MQTDPTAPAETEAADERVPRPLPAQSDPDFWNEVDMWKDFARDEAADV